MPNQRLGPASSSLEIKLFMLAIFGSQNGKFMPVLKGACAQIVFANNSRIVVIENSFIF
jgi:hypothetical protein